MNINNTKLHEGHMGLIFAALEVGLEDLPDQGFTLEHSGTPIEIDADRFNRMLVTIDGHQYCVSVFQPAQAPIDPVDLNLVENATVDTGA